MHLQLRDLPVRQQGEHTRTAGVDDWGGQAANYNELPAGLNFAPALQGLPHDLCPSAHWGYMIEGRMRVQYEDGSEEVTHAGDLYYYPPGHTAKVEEDARFVEFSPATEFARVMEHMQAERRSS